MCSCPFLVGNVQHRPTLVDERDALALVQIVVSRVPARARAHLQDVALCLPHKLPAVPVDARPKLRTADIVVEVAGDLIVAVRDVFLLRGRMYS